MLHDYMESYATRDYAIRKIPHSLGPFDSENIPLIDTKFFHLKGPPIYHPVVISQYALAQYELWRSGKENAKDIFLLCANWLEKNAIEEPKGRFAIWPYNFPHKFFRISPPWISGMAQGQGLSVLVRSFYETKSESTARVLQRVARSYIYSVEDGGILIWLTKNACFIEEIAHTPSIHILNGCLFALLGLFEYLQLFDDKYLHNIFLACIRGVEKTLPAFDCGWWSRYSLGIRWHLAPKSYHKTHILQLKYLGNVLDHPQFLTYASRWEDYSKQRFNRFIIQIYEPLQINLNRFLTLLRFDSLKYTTK